MHPQRWILVAALALAVGYVWLDGGFIGVTQVERGCAPGTPSPATRGWLWRRSPPAVSGASNPTSTSCQGSSRQRRATPAARPEPDLRAGDVGGTGHTEAVQVVYDPAVVSYDQLLDHYWRNVDPFVAHRQFCDVGSQYRPVIFFHTEAQRAAAEASKARIQKMFQPDCRGIVAGRPVLPGGGVSPGLLQEEQRAVPVLPVSLRPRSAARAMSDPRRIEDRADRHRPSAPSGYGARFCLASV